MSISELTVGQIAQVEELSGLPFMALTDPATPKGRLYQAVAYVIKHKQDPTFTFEQAGELGMSEINALMGDDSPLA